VVLNEKNNQAEYHFDPSNPDAQLTYLKLSKVFGGELQAVKESETNIVPLTLNGTRYIDFLVPGLVAMGIMMSCMWGISYGIIEKRSKKLLRRLVATPMKKSHFLMALISVRMLMNLIEGILLVVFAYFVFDFKIQGSIPALFIIFLAGNIAFAGIAVFLSSRTAKTEIGNAFINVVNMPMMVLSGIFFSYHNFPDWTIPIIQKFPLTLMTDDMRSVFIEGAGVADIAVHSLILAFSGLVFFVFGLKIFKWH
jgi:ABC-2 type transport system permease protein